MPDYLSWNLDLPLNYCVTLSKFLTLSDSSFLIYKMESIT